MPWSVAEYALLENIPIQEVAFASAVRLVLTVMLKAHRSVLLAQQTLRLLSKEA